MYNGTVLKKQSLDSLNVGKGISFDVIIEKENKQLLPRKYVTIEGVKFLVAGLKNVYLCCLCIREQTIFISWIKQKNIIIMVSKLCVKFRNYLIINYIKHDIKKHVT